MQIRPINTLHVILNGIKVRYDPEHDVPPGPTVTWADEKLAEAITILEQHVGAQNQTISDLIHHINGMEQDITLLQQELKNR